MKLFLWPLLTSVIVGIILALIAIPILKKLNFGQNVRTDGPQTHLKKSGTPTMGGLIFIINMIAVTIFWADMSKTMWFAIIFTTLYGVLGFADDFLKTARGKSLGLRAWQKMAGEIVIAFLLIFVATLGLNRGTELVVPFYGAWEAGVFYYILAFILVAGVTNGVNLNDGMDGLAAGTAFFAYLGYGIIAYSCIGQPPFQGISYGALTVFCGAMAGLCLSFLVFNHHPAKVFMGDTGSLFLGGGLAVISILTGTELLLVVIGGIYVIEALSVMIQVVGYKLTKKRVFPMAPIHHSFEVENGLNWKENKVVLIFWLGAFIFMVLGLLIYFK
ncbi:MAG: phospho-N-acetylmuramoyl-pentapeptide-transferase [Clostridiales bacterium]